MTLEHLNLLIYGAGGIAQVLQLGLQLYGYRRTPHFSVAMLAIATLAGLAYLGAALVVTLVSAHSHWMRAAILAMVLCFAVQILLGVWGTAALLRSYRVLSGQA
jgi:hypothetical protein